MDADIDGGAVSLLPLDALNVHAELLAVALDNLANLLAFVVAADNLNLVVLANRDGPKISTYVSTESLKMGAATAYLTPYLERRSFDNGAVINFLLM